MISFINIFLILIILFILFYINKKKIRIFFTKKNIKSVDVTEVDEIFLPEKKNNLMIPSKKTYVNFFFIPDSFSVVGMTQDYEAWILSVISSKSKQIFEFGTCSGKTTLLMAMNSPSNSKIFTITLDKESALKLKHGSSDNPVAKRNILNESFYEKFMFSDTIYEKKINVIFKDSKMLDIKDFRGKFDLIFIDGGHTYSCVKNDTEKALEMINSNGFIFWHDYSVGKRSHKDVFKYLNDLALQIEIKHIKNTTLCYFKKN